MTLCTVLTDSTVAQCAHDPIRSMGGKLSHKDAPRPSLRGVDSEVGGVQELASDTVKIGQRSRPRMDVNWFHVLWLSASGWRKFTLMKRWHLRELGGRNEVPNRRCTNI